jgi:regulator of ribonuclease activity A
MSISFTPAAFFTPDLDDQYSDDLANTNAPLQIFEPIFRSFGGRQSFCGEIVTVKCFEDNSVVKAQLAEPGAGRVLIVDGGGSMRCALLGDKIAADAVENQWSGVIVFGCVRDVGELCQMDLGVYALAAHPRKSVRKGKGDLNLTLSFAGVCVQPKHFAYVDANGILISPVRLF